MKYCYINVELEPNQIKPRKTTHIHTQRFTVYNNTQTSSIKKSHRKTYIYIYIWSSQKQERKKTKLYDVLLYTEQDDYQFISKDFIMSPFNKHTLSYTSFFIRPYNTYIRIFGRKLRKY